MGKSLDQLMKEVNKKFNAEILGKGIPQYEGVRKIPFSSPRLNYMVYGGLPVGRMYEFSGDENSGKTTTALDLVKNAQILFPDQSVLYADCENTLDTDWARLLGVNVDELILLQPETETAEQIFQVIVDAVETGEVSLVVIDSLGVMVSGLAYEKDMEGKTYGGISAALTLFSKKMIPILARHGATLVGINQMREDMNSMYGGTTTTGGKGWKHNCSARLQFQKSDYIDAAGNSLTRSCENPAGNLVKCNLVKTKICRPDRKVGFYTLKYLEGIDYVSDTIDVAAKEGIINKAGAWYTLLEDWENGVPFIGDDDKPLKFQGKPKLWEFLRDNSNYFEIVTNQINTIIS